MKIKSIVFKQVEGRTWELVEKECTSLDELNRVIHQASATAPDDGSYNKSEFTIEWEDGQKYKGRVDLQRNMLNNYDIRKHMKISLDEMIEWGSVSKEEAYKFYKEYVESN